MKKAKSILKQWLYFAESIGLDFAKAQQIAVEHCQQNNDHKNAKRISQLSLNDVWEGCEDNLIYSLIVGLRKGEIKAFEPMYNLEPDTSEFTHDEPCESVCDELHEAHWIFNEMTKEFELYSFTAISDGIEDYATVAQLDALQELLISPTREEFTEYPDEDFYLDTI